MAKKKRPARFRVHTGGGARGKSGSTVVRQMANILGRGKGFRRSDRPAFADEVMEAAGVLAGLADAAMDAGWKDVEPLVEEARQKLFEAVELLQAEGTP